MIGTTEVEAFRDAVASRFGLCFDDTKDELLADLLRRRAAATGCTPLSYVYAVAASEVGDDELGVLAAALTVAETYFFRNIEQFHALAETVVPERVKERAATRTLRVLSAGCATGEEPYTIAMVLRDLIEPGWDVGIRAADLNPAVLERARRGRYSRWSLRETPVEMQARWFTSTSRGVALDDAIRGAVSFERHNLAATDAPLWGDAVYDVVFCRNVLMYFTPERARAVVARIARALAPGGYCFLGHAETLRGLSQDFDLCHTHGTFYYRRRAEPVRGREVAPPKFVTRPVTGAPVATGEWADAIQRASERVARLAAALPARERALDRPASWDLADAHALLREERFVDALRVVDGLPTEAGHDADVLLLRSVLLVHAGMVEGAEATCRTLLGVDDLSAGAHYVLALCRESAGDLAGAVEHDRMAVHLDPGFAMARLHLGLLARRTGDDGAARHELDAAAVLLEREDASRLLLFGGGFGRGALIALCRNDLAAGVTS
ncbi:MAG TPA: protein-glutamate O-methyltransferase CheR [Acidimicrobiia bacterium]|nr:protein-glutamate O-methyltransferase CheR [Acidimicrobiia bacterium]